MGVMDFLKGLFSSKQEDQGVSNIHITEAGPQEPTPEEPKMPEISQETPVPPIKESSENADGADDSGFQE